MKLSKVDRGVVGVMKRSFGREVAEVAREIERERLWVHSDI
jgi:hypothetical protein